MPVDVAGLWIRLRSDDSEFGVVRKSSWRRSTDGDHTRTGSLTGLGRSRSGRRRRPRYGGHARSGCAAIAGSGSDGVAASGSRSPRRQSHLGQPRNRVLAGISRQYRLDRGGSGAEPADQRSGARNGNRGDPRTLLFAGFRGGAGPSDESRAAFGSRSELLVRHGDRQGHPRHGRPRSVGARRQPSGGEYRCLPRSANRHPGLELHHSGLQEPRCDTRRV